MSTLFWLLILISASASFSDEHMEVEEEYEESPPDSPPSSTIGPQTSNQYPTTQEHIISHPDIQTTTAAPGGFEIFTASGTFRIPMGVRRVRVLAVGGGSGGLSGKAGGGGSGYVRSGEFDVTPGQSVLVVVGIGSAGSTYKESSCWQDVLSGGTSSFGSLISAAGGESRNRSCDSGGVSGGSGGGGGLGMEGTSGAGGTNGANGNNATDSGTLVGVGQGSFTPHLQLFTRNRLTPGAGGSGRYTSDYYEVGVAGGGGGGGVLLNGNGPTAQAGTDSILGGFGGSGFGGGGGAGGKIYRPPHSEFAGGRGANGLVYIEW